MEKNKNNSNKLIENLIKKYSKYKNDIIIIKNENLDQKITELIKIYQKNNSKTIIYNQNNDKITNNIKKILQKYNNINYKLKNIRNSKINNKRILKNYQDKYIQQKLQTISNKNIYNKINIRYSKYCNIINKLYINNKIYKFQRSKLAITFDTILNRIYNDNSNLLYYNTEYKIKAKRIKNLYIDYYLIIIQHNKLHEIYIEIDGDQHYKNIKFLNSINIIQSDMIKEDYANIKCISFIRINKNNIYNSYKLVNNYINNMNNNPIYKNTMIDNKNILKNRQNIINIPIN